MNALARLLEKRVSRMVYGRRPIIAVSPATRAEVRRRLKLKGPIHVVPNGIEPHPIAQLPKRSEAPTLVYVGRLVAHKRLHLLLEATVRLRERWPDLRVNIAGAGPARPELEQLARRLQLHDAVRFWGWVTDDQRTELLASAWLLVTPSAAEGWGLTVIEANAAGRPALACRVPGLANSIAHGVNGWLLDDVRQLPEGVDSALQRLSDQAEVARLEMSCRRWASQFSWDRTAQRMGHVLWTAGLGRTVDGHRASPVTSDAATIVILEATAGLDRIQEVLPPSDLWRVEGNTLRILLPGHDVSTAISSLEALGLSGHARVRVARNSDLLLGLNDPSAG
jgi:hypothetical protein